MRHIGAQHVAHNSLLRMDPLAEEVVEVDLNLSRNVSQYNPLRNCMSQHGNCRGRHSSQEPGIGMGLVVWLRFTVSATPARCALARSSTATAVAATVHRVEPDIGMDLAVPWAVQQCTTVRSYRSCYSIQNTCTAVVCMCICVFFEFQGLTST
jgi:hypothetical protein